MHFKTKKLGFIPSANQPTPLFVVGAINVLFSTFFLKFDQISEVSLQIADRWNIFPFTCNGLK